MKDEGPLVVEVFLEDLEEGDPRTILQRVMTLVHEEQTATPLVFLHDHRIRDMFEGIMLMTVQVSYMSPVADWAVFRDQVCRILEHMADDVHLLYTFEPAAIACRPRDIGTRRASVFVLFKCVVPAEMG